MVTLRQKRVAKKLIENIKLDKPKTGGEIVASSGYGVSMKKNPQVIINSEGVKEALIEYGFSEERAKIVVGSILEKGKEENRIRAADMIFKTHGTYAPERRLNINIEAVPSKDIEELAARLNDA